MRERSQGHTTGITSKRFDTMANARFLVNRIPIRSDLAQRTMVLLDNAGLHPSSPGSLVSASHE